jgi:dihydroorotate dehydrogenase
MLPYRLLRPLLFQVPAETAHQLGAGALDAALLTAPQRAFARAWLDLRDPALAVECFGIGFPNPVGLAAGFDKTGEHFNALGALGFGFVEIGTVTTQPQPGNPPPRLFRLPADRALLNRMGFNNPGAQAVARRLRRTPIEPVLGINLGKSKVTPLENATADYLRSLELLEPFARYLVVNVSSPNTPGLRTLQDAKPLRELLSALRARAAELAGDRHEAAKPILLKIAPDLTDEQIDEAMGIAVEEGISGIIATNTTVSRDGLRTPRAQVEALGAGGISGAPLRQRARDVVGRVWKATEGRMPIVGVGGIFSGDDAWEMVRAGASLVQVYTGFVYGGPEMVRDVNRGLLRRLRREGLANVGEAVGLAHR